MYFLKRLLSLLKKRKFTLANKNWTQTLNFFTVEMDSLFNIINFVLLPCLAKWSVSGLS